MTGTTHLTFSYTRQLAENKGRLFLFNRNQLSSPEVMGGMRLDTKGWGCEECGRNESIAVSPSERLRERRENFAEFERQRLVKEKQRLWEQSAEREHLIWTLKRF